MSRGIFFGTLSIWIVISVRVQRIKCKTEQLDKQSNLRTCIRVDDFVCASPTLIPHIGTIQRILIDVNT